MVPLDKEIQYGDSIQFHPGVACLRTLEHTTCMELDQSQKFTNAYRRIHACIFLDSYVSPSLHKKCFLMHIEIFVILYDSKKGYM